MRVEWLICFTPISLMDETGNDVAVGPADFYLSARFQHQKAFAIGMGLHLTHLV
jgi:hypothetical protein